MRRLLAIFLLASQCLAAGDSTVRELDERHDVAGAAAQFEVRPESDAKFAPARAERGGQVVSDPVGRLGVDPAPSAHHRAGALDDDLLLFGTQDGQMERRPFAGFGGERWRTELSTPCRSFEPNDDARLAKLVAKELAELQKRGCDCNELGRLHYELDAITRELKRQTFAIEHVERIASYGWTAFWIILALRLVVATVKALAGDE